MNQTPSFRIIYSAKDLAEFRMLLAEYPSICIVQAPVMPQGEQIARTSAPAFNGKAELEYKVRYGTFRSFTPEKEIALGINGLSRNEQVEKILLMRDNGILTKDKNNVYWLNGISLNKMTSGEMSASGSTVTGERLPEIDCEDVV